MSIASVRVKNAADFRANRYSELMPAADKDRVTPLLADKFAVGDTVVQDSWGSVLPTSSQYGQSASFTIPRAAGRIYELILEATFPAETIPITGLYICPYPIVKLISGYQLNIGGNLINTTGENMFQVRQSYLSANSKKFYATMAGGTSAASMDNSVDVTAFMVVDYPGGFSVNQDCTVYNHDDSYGIPFPLNKCNNDMNVIINLAQRADMFVTGTGTLQPTLKLHYHSVYSSDDNENMVLNSTNKEKIFIPGYDIGALVPTGLSITTSAETNIDISSAVKYGQLLKLLVRASTSAAIASKLYMNGNSLATLRLTVNGIDFFAVTTASEAVMKDGNNRRADPFYDGYVNPYYYEIWGSTDPYQVASDQYQCLNLFRNNPSIKLTSGGAPAALTNVNIISVTKCVYCIDKYGTVNKWLSTSG